METVEDALSQSYLNLDGSPTEYKKKEEFEDEVSQSYLNLDGSPTESFLYRNKISEGRSPTLIWMALLQEVKEIASGMNGRSPTLIWMALLPGNAQYLTASDKVAVLP